MMFDFITNVNNKWGFCGFISVLQKLSKPEYKKNISSLFPITDIRIEVIFRIKHLNKYLETYKKKDLKINKAIEDEFSWIVFHCVCEFLKYLNNSGKTVLIKETIDFTNSFFISGITKRSNLIDFRLSLYNAFLYYAKNNTKTDEITPFGLALSVKTMKELLSWFQLDFNDISNHKAPQINYQNCLLGVIDSQPNKQPFDNEPTHWLYVDSKGNVSDYGDTYANEINYLGNTWIEDYFYQKQYNICCIIKFIN